MLTETRICPQCSKSFEILLRNVRKQLKRSKSGRLFCSRVCYGLFQRLPPEEPMEGYRHGIPWTYEMSCRCEPCKEAHRNRVNKYRRLKRT